MTNNELIRHQGNAPKATNINSQSKNSAKAPTQIKATNLHWSALRPRSRPVTAGRDTVISPDRAMSRPSTAIPDTAGATAPIGS
jgi:hypothetical protein